MTADDADFADEVFQIFRKGASMTSPISSASICDSD